MAGQQNRKIIPKLVSVIRTMVLVSAVEVVPDAMQYRPATNYQ